MENADRPSHFTPDALDSGALPATTDSLRAVLARHRARQYRVLGAGLVVVLLAGAFAGFAIGRDGQRTTQLSAAPASPAAGAGANQTALATSGGASAPGQATSVGPVVLPSIQLLLRNATDGTRVRLYRQDLSAKSGCVGSQACPADAVPPCVPTQFLLAEVSDDQVAGTAGGPSWQPASPTGLDPLSAETVGIGQPQPILVVVAHAGPDVSRVQLTTPYGADSEVPVGGWVALAVRLPQTFTPSAGRPDVPDGTVTASGPAGATLSTVAVADVSMKSSPPCQRCALNGSPPSKTGKTATTFAAGPNASTCSSCVVTGPPPNSPSAKADAAKACSPCVASSAPGAPGMSSPSVSPGAAGAPTAPTPMTSCGAGFGGGASGTVTSGSGSSSPGSVSSGSVASAPPMTTTP